MKTEIEKLKSELLASDSCHIEALRELEEAKSKLAITLRALSVMLIWAEYDSVNSHDVKMACESAISAAAMPNI